MLGLEEEMHASPTIREAVRDELFARELYDALCNVEWRKAKMLWYVSWRGAGRIVAELRDQNEGYMDFYCSGNEGHVSETVRSALAALGWTPEPDSEQ